MTWPVFRGQVVRSDILELDEPKLFVVVSNNGRNRNFDTVLAARLTTSPKNPRPSIVELANDEQLTGRVLCDDIWQIFDDEVIEVVGSLGRRTLSDLDHGLMAALGIGSGS